MPRMRAKSKKGSRTRAPAARASTKRPAKTAAKARDMHLSPAARESAIKLLDEPDGRGGPLEAAIPKGS